MKRRFALFSMIALFGIAYATLDRVPRSVLRVLEIRAELVSRSEAPELSTGSDA